MALAPPRSRLEFDTAIIRALPLEADCVHAVFDKLWDNDGRSYGKAVGDPNAYTTGVIENHNVVLAHLPHMGIASASSVATCLQFSYPNINLALVVGVCGGVPYDVQNNTTILLGDVILSQALVQYRFGRQYPEKFEEKSTVEDSIGRPPQDIGAILAQLKTRHYLQVMQKNMSIYLRSLQEKLPEAKYPTSSADRVYPPGYLHKHHDNHMCEECSRSKKSICHIAIRMSCDELGCVTPQVDANRPQNTAERLPALHFGKMGSGHTVMKSGEECDRIARADGIIAFEMEGAGVGSHFPSIVIKGVCDFADSHKNKEWQHYAAATAAAYTKTFLRE